MLFLSMSWSTESTLVITIFSHSPTRSPVVGMLRLFCQKAYLLIGDVNMFREIFIGLLTIQEWLWTGASGNQNDGGGRRKSLARKQGLWLQGVKPVLTGLPDGRSCPGPPWHLLPWKGAAEAWDWQGAPQKKADAQVTVIAAGWGTGPSFLPRDPSRTPACAMLQRSKTTEEREPRFTCQLLSTLEGACQYYIQVGGPTITSQGTRQRQEKKRRQWEMFMTPTFQHFQKVDALQLHPTAS